MYKNRRKHIRNLVMRIWNGDSESFTDLYAMTCDDIYNYCRCMLKDNDKALHATRDVYIYALDNILHLTDPTLFEAWIRRIAYQKCSDEILEHTQHYRFQFADPDQLEDLPFYERQILFMSEFCDLKTNEISNILDISKNEVEKCLKSAGKHLIALKRDGVFY